MAITIFSIIGINNVVSNRQELANVNEEIVEKQLNKIHEKISISGVINDDGATIITNDGTQDVEIIQIRVYDNQGNFVKSFPLNYTVSGNTSMEFENLPSELQTMFGLSTIFENNDAFGYSFVGITSNGVEIPIILENNLSSENVGEGTGSTNATSVLDGLGYTAFIDIFQELGKVIWGHDTIGIEKPITPYTPTDSTADFAAVMLDTDAKNTYAISEFWREYTFNGNSLVDTTPEIPNVLGYSQSRNTVGTNTVSINDGIIVSGSGSTILKLNDYTGQFLVLKGDAGTGILKLITSDVDLINAPYSGYGYTMYSGAIDPAPTSLNVVSGIDSTSTGIFSFQQYYHLNHNHHCKCSIHDHGNVWGGTITLTSSLVKNYNGDHAIVTGDNTNPYNIASSYYIGPINTGNYYFTLYDTLPSYEKLAFSGTFETDHTFTSDITYLYVEPNGGTVTIKGESVTEDTPIITINDLPKNTPYQISKNGWIGVSGVTSNDGSIILYENDINFKGFTTLGGLLHLYPDSLSYRGSYDTIAFDSVNKEIFHTNTGVNQVYAAAAYVKLPIPLDVTINEVKIGDISLDYLTGNYTEGDEVYVPIIPEMKTLSLTLNEQSAVINLSDITNTAQSKVLSSATYSDSAYSHDSAITSIEISTTSSAVAIATHTGTMNVHIEETVSGEAEFTINSDYTDSYSQPYDSCQAAMAAYGGNNGCVQHGHPVDVAIQSALVASQAAYEETLAGHVTALSAAVGSQGPLTVTTEIFVNGIYYDKYTIHRDNTPNLTASYNLGLVSVQNAKLQYEQSSGSRTISVPVQSGDYVEFVVTASIISSGIPAPIDLDNSKVAGFARGTVNIHHGIVTATMG